MKRKTISLLILFFAFWAFLPTKDLLAAPYYKGKTITMNCGSEVGGGHDFMARLIARRMSEHIPGKPTIVVKNMPGAIGVIALNYIYNIAKPDGLTIGIFNRGMAFGQLQKAQGIKFDLTKFLWLGSAAVEATVFTIRSNFPYKTFADLKNAKEPINVGCTGTTGVDYALLMLLEAFTDVKFRIVMYPSGSAAMLAMERGEVDARAGSYNSLRPYIQRGLARPVLRGNAYEPEIKGLPVDEDIVTDKKGKTFLAMRSMPDQFGRPFVAPPGTPANQMKILREAFAATVTDPQTIKDAEKTNISLQYISADKSLGILNTLLNQPANIINEFNKYVKFN